MEGVTNDVNYGQMPHFETLAEVRAAADALDYYAQLLGYGLLPAYCLQHVRAEVRNRQDELVAS